ncbi:MAG: hypothetical protein IKG18_08460 [Atopobiaceae bacterium]|nr:hypothetical protein [Atopobiaceae bacterium]
MLGVDDVAARADVMIGGFAALVREGSIKAVNLNTGIGAVLVWGPGTT